MKTKILTIEEVRAVLARVEFAASCVDMGWKWEVGEVNGEDVRFGLDGFLIRTTFRRPDRDSGQVSTGFGRWWHVPSDVTEAGIMKTAFAAAKLILEHELMEAFRFDGTRVFDPHHDVDDLKAAARSAAERRQT